MDLRFKLYLLLLPNNLPRYSVASAKPKSWLSPGGHELLWCFGEGALLTRELTRKDTSETPVHSIYVLYTTLHPELTCLRKRPGSHNQIHPQCYSVLASEIPVSLAVCAGPVHRLAGHQEQVHAHKVHGAG